jgi:hypothetical protein
LQRHESRHGRAHTELARFVIARRQHAAPIASATHADRLAAQRGTIAYLDRGIKAIHVEVDNGAGFRLILHSEISHDNSRMALPYNSEIIVFRLCNERFSFNITNVTFS